MLKRVTAVLVAWQLEDGSYEVFSLPVHLFEANMRPTASTGASGGKVGVVDRTVFFLRN
jgi:hypothetical protein